jgi:hypothetical protein
MLRVNLIFTAGNIKNAARFISIIACMFLTGPIAIVSWLNLGIGGLRVCRMSVNVQTQICLERIQVGHGSETSLKSERSLKSVENPHPGILRNTYRNPPPPPVALPVPLPLPVGGERPAH